MCRGGIFWFPDHYAWAAFAFVLVLRPPKEQVIVVGLGRTLGTVAGVVIGYSSPTWSVTAR